MFDIKIAGNNTIQLLGRFDASQVEKAKNVFNEINESYIVDFSDLDYISSAGLSVLLMTQKRLGEVGSGLKLINMNNHILDIFNYAGFDAIFEIKQTNFFNFHL